jgi:uncharacterized protein YciI
MRRVAASLLLTLTLAACGTLGAPSLPAAPAPAYDAALAARLGADERGMRRYVLVILKTGPATNLSDADRARAFEGHFANINRLAGEDLLSVAGPLSANDRQYRGIYVFNVATVEEAARLVATDPAVVAGIFDYEAYPWYASAALMETSAIHSRIQPPAE